MKVKLGKTSLRINISFAAVITLMLILDESGICAVALLCCIIHEAGHIICLFFLGEQPASVELSFYGIKLERKEPSILTVAEELAVYIAGPAMNFVLSAALFLFGAEQSGIKTAAVISLCIGAFNLIPCRPLDGGNVVFRIISMFADNERAEKISFEISVVILFPMAAAGIIMLLRSTNVTLIAVTAYLAAVCVSSRRK
ncbi:MAG: site-2 protease family protein [Clostridia bacterium]|nr:site-2 protease family protein [Clostridia bacterium]